MSTALTSYGAAALGDRPVNWGNILGIGALGVVGYRMATGGRYHTPGWPKYRENPLPLVLGLGLGTWALLGGTAWAGYKVKDYFFSGAAVTGLFVGGALGFAYGMYRDERPLAMGMMGMALGWGLFKIYDESVA